MTEDPRALSGEILALMRKQGARTGAEEMRLSALYLAFGDKASSDRALKKAALKGDREAQLLIRKQQS